MRALGRHKQHEYVHECPGNRVRYNIGVPDLKYQEMAGEGRVESSVEIAQRVERARQRQQRRFARERRHLSR